MEPCQFIAFARIKSEIESIRGVNCDYAIQKLLEKNSLKQGRSEGLGKPLLYGTSLWLFWLKRCAGPAQIERFLKCRKIPLVSPLPGRNWTPVMVDGESVHLSASTIVLEAEENCWKKNNWAHHCWGYWRSDVSTSDEFYRYSRMTENTLINRVDQSGIVTIDLEKFYPGFQVFSFDLKDYLFMAWF